MIDDQQLEVIVINSAAVLTSMPEKKTEWRGVIADAWQRAGDVGVWHERAFLEALLCWLDGKPAPTLAAENPYRAALEKIQGLVKAGGIQAPPLPPESVDALNKLLTSATWADARRVLEDQTAILLDPQVEDALDQLVESAVNDGKPELAENFAMHRDLLRLCRERGIEAAFKDFGIQEDMRAALIEMAALGLGGSQAQRMGLAQQVARMLQAETDPAERQLLETLQMAVFSKHPAAVKHNLQGEQAQVRQEIKARIESKE